MKQIISTLLLVFKSLSFNLWNLLVRDPHIFNICSTEEIFSSNSEAFASELLKNLKEMFPLHYMDSDRYCIFNFQSHNSM